MGIGERTSNNNKSESKESFFGVFRILNIKLLSWDFQQATERTHTCIHSCTLNNKMRQDGLCGNPGLIHKIQIHVYIQYTGYCHVLNKTMHLVQRSYVHQVIQRVKTHTDVDSTYK